MLRIEEVLIALAFVLAFAITGTMDAADAELSASATHAKLQEPNP